MREQLQRLLRHPVVKKIHQFCGDPVQLYVVFLMMTVMYYYHSSMCWLYTIATVFLSYAVMKFYDFVANHKYLGPVCYIAYMIAGLFLVGFLVVIGEVDYPIEFVVWFLTPQSVVDFSFWYTLATYCLMLGFLTSTVYYFAKVRYRMLMQFVIMLIPLCLYAKEGIQMPALLVILLLSAYFLLMIYCRQLRENQEVRRISSSQGNASIALYVLAFSILSAIVPKPEIKADREFIENVMATSSLSDVLMNAIQNIFLNSTDNSFTTNNSSRTLYYVSASENLRLRTTTFSYYLADDSWNTIPEYDYPNAPCPTELTYAPADLLNAILEAAGEDEAFARDYGLSDVTDTEIPEQTWGYLKIIPRFSSNAAPSPTRTYLLGPELASDAVQLSVTHVFNNAGKGTMDMYYYPDTYARNAQVNAVLCRLEGETYYQLLCDAAGILESKDHEGAALLLECARECEEAYAYLAAVGEEDFHSDAIAELAEEITAGLDSDYEKAHAIEQYFTEEGFVYDAGYQKGAAENAEDFLLETRRGVCYEYATAMVLLCRAAGLPARYVQGYSLSEQYDSGETNYVIKGRNAHGFPEVYIAGYGWLSFEPTVAVSESWVNAAEHHSVMLWGFGLLGAVLLAGGVWLLLPRIREWWFRRKLAAMSPEKAAAAIFSRMRRIMKLPESVTVMELLEHTAAFCEDAVLFLRIDAILYGNVSSVTTRHLTEGYVRWQEARIAYEKQVKQQKREARRLAKQQRRNQT